MKKIVFLLLLSSSVAAQTIGSGYAALTVDATAGGVPIPAALLAKSGEQFPSACSGVLLTAPINFRYDGGAPTSAVGMPLAVGDRISLVGITNLAQWRGIRTTGTSGELRWTCEK